MRNYQSAVNARGILGHFLPRGNRIVQLDPRFPPEMWSVYQRTLDGASRTNNYAEAANRRIQSELGHGRDQQYMQWVSGRQPKDKRKKYKDVDKRILKILQKYQRDERSVIELLRGVLRILSLMMLLELMM
ncbi:hypothetical protein DdX_17724 [Ditylenchus destructor]|uniref:Uncharacterized protein n=1 Tax=Ditylenchus destructor TaxID=166010 RepID=A0AAD4MLL2_9BILA|nr:hypothetical protein DdX_17724 [Ditylenchus destructor]